MAAQQRLAALDAALASPQASAAQRESADAHDALARAHAATQTAQDRIDAADTEARRFEANDLAAAVEAVDAATRDVSTALAQLLRDSAASTSLTAAVDGLALRDRYRAATATTPPTWDHTTIPFPATPGDVIDPELALPPVDPTDGSGYRQLLAVLDRLDERVDAVADLTAAESVHQLVAGNTTRSGSSLAVASEGRVPDEFDVIRTPRPGADVLHRLLVVADPTAPAPWTTARPGPAALLDPVSTAWVAGILPDPVRVSARLRLVGPDGADLANPIDLPMSELELDPLGWIRVAAGGTELQARLALAADRRRRAGGGTPPPAGRTILDDTGPPPTGGVGLAALLAAASAAGRVLAASRALDPADLAHPADPQPAPPSKEAVEQIAQRVRDVERWTTTLVATLDAAVAAGVPDPAALVDALLAASAAGVIEAVPPLGTMANDPRELSRDLLASLATAAAGRLRLRQTPAPFAADPADPASSLTRARARADELVGMRLPLPAEVNPQLDGVATADLASGASRLGGADPATVRSWLLDHARVRPAVRALVDALDLAEAVDAAAVLDPRVTQRPSAAPDTWAGATAKPRSGVASVIVQATYGDRLPATVAGLAVDTWSQPVPAERHDTGVAFHYDRPDATPPQALLVAVHPDPSADRPVAQWDLDTLLDVVTSTMALARDRATAAERCTTAGVEVVDG
ncbi:MAG TPA: hypothetical protein VMW35_21535 [Myxococcota bacterium]|nr:hypothetical protein [Myxococcota bacterium]